MTVPDKRPYVKRHILVASKDRTEYHRQYYHLVLKKKAEGEKRLE